MGQVRCLHVFTAKAGQVCETEVIDDHQQHIEFLRWRGGVSRARWKEPDRKKVKSNGLEAIFLRSVREHYSVICGVKRILAIGRQVS